MEQLKDHLYLLGDSPVEMVLGKDGNAVYESVKEHLSQYVEPDLMEYLKSLEMAKVISGITDLQVLEKTEVVYLTQEFKERLATELDGFELPLEQKVWLYVQFLTRFHQGAMAFCDSFFSQRAKELAQKKRIISL